jgi:hypothetical protein
MTTFTGIFCDLSTVSLTGNLIVCTGNACNNKHNKQQDQACSYSRVSHILLLFNLLINISGNNLPVELTSTNAGCICGKNGSFRPAVKEKTGVIHSRLN